MTNIFRVSRIFTSKHEKRGNLAILCEINLRQLAYRYREKYLLSVTVTQHLSREKSVTINFKVIIKFYF